jgi:hypothetical protein
MQKVRVYRNLNRKSINGPVYSIMDAKTRRVIGHTTSLLLEQVIFRVSQAGKARAIRTLQRNVHAFIEGYICDDIKLHMQHTSCKVTYKPFDSLNFRTAYTGIEVTTADYVQIDNNGVYAYWRTI